MTDRDMNIGPIVLNAYVDTNNRIEHEDIESILKNTFMDIANVLSDHCGPYGKLAMIPSQNNILEEPVFTKDGINIVRAMEYASVMQTYVKQTLAYMGSRIERAAGDGTTSSMIICAKAMWRLLSEIEKLYNDESKAYTLQELETTYSKFVEMFISYYTLYTKNGTDDVCFINEHKNVNDAIYKIAFCQAYTSTSDKQLSKMIAKLFSTTPKEAWNDLYIDKSPYESGERYTIEKDDNQYTVENARIFPKSEMTEDFGYRCIRNDITLLITGRVPSIGDMDTGGMRTTIEKHIINKIPLAVICPDDMDVSTTEWLNELFKTNSESKVVFFFIPIRDRIINDITNICALTNKRGQYLTVEHISLEFNGKKLQLNGLYENPNNSVLHPYYNNPEYRDYNELIKHLDKIIVQIKKDVANKHNNQQLNELQKYKLKLMVSKRNYFLIGGSAYDAAASIDIAIDAMLAVKHTLTTGFAYGSNVSFELTCKHIKELYEKEDNKELLIAYCDSFLEGIQAVVDANYKYSGKKPPNYERTRSYDITEDYLHTGLYELNELDEITNEEIYKSPIIIQPKNIDIEMIKRFGELALKFIRMHRIIAPGGLYSKKKKDDK